MRRGGPAEHPVRLPHRLGQGSDVDGVDPPAVEHPGQALDVVGVQVAQDDQRDVVDTEVVETALHLRGVGAGVEHHRSRPGIEHQPVALSDVASDEGPAVRRPRSGGQPKAEEGDQQSCQPRAHDPPRGAMSGGYHNAHGQHRQTDSPSR